MTHGRGSTCNGREMVRAPVVVLTTFLSAIAIWFYGAGPAWAPEPAKLKVPLATTTPAAAETVYSRKPTEAYYLSGSWTPSSIPAGLPCSRSSPLPKGTIITTFVEASGPFRRCR
jgi:hypothetical protein